MGEDERFEVSRVKVANAAEIFALLCSPAGRVAIDSTGMLQSADGHNVRAVGDTFIVHMDRESLNPDPWIEWAISGTVQPPIEHRYGYRLEPVEGGTRVTSYYDWSQILERHRPAGLFPVIPEANLHATLGILARTLERPT